MGISLTWVAGPPNFIPRPWGVYRDWSWSASVGFGSVVSRSQMRGTWGTHFTGRTHFHGTQARRQSQNPPLQKSSAIPA